MTNQLPPASAAPSISAANQESSGPEGWLTSAQAAAALGIDSRRFQHYADRAKLPRFKSGARPLSRCFYDPVLIQKVAAGMEKRNAATLPVAERADGVEQAVTGSEAIPEAVPAKEAVPVKVQTPLRASRSLREQRSIPTAAGAGTAAVDKADIIRQAVSAVLAQTALLEKIVQNVGRV